MRVRCKNFEGELVKLERDMKVANVCLAAVMSKYVYNIVIADKKDSTVKYLLENVEAEDIEFIGGSFVCNE